MKASQITAGMTVKIGTTVFKVHSVATCGFTGKVHICRSGTPGDCYRLNADADVTTTW